MRLYSQHCIRIPYVYIINIFLFSDWLLTKKWNLEVTNFTIDIKGRRKAMPRILLWLNRAQSTNQTACRNITIFSLIELGDTLEPIIVPIFNYYYKFGVANLTPDLKKSELNTRILAK